MFRKLQPPVSVSQSELRTTEVARQFAADVFRMGVSERAISNVVASVADLAEALTEEQKQSDPPEFPIACRAGCSHCCYMRVLVTEPEVIFLLQFIRETFTEVKLQQLISRLQDTDRATRGMSEENRGGSGIPCPLLSYS